MNQDFRAVCCNRARLKQQCCRNGLKDAIGSCSGWWWHLPRSSSCAWEAERVGMCCEGIGRDLGGRVNLSCAPCDMGDLQLFLKTEEIGKLLWFL